MTQDPTKRKVGRPLKYPNEGGKQTKYQVMLTPAQVARALSLGDTVSQGINAALRELVPVAPEPK